MKTKKIFVLLLCIIIAAAVAGCTQTQPETQPEGEQTRVRYNRTNPQNSPNAGYDNYGTTPRDGYSSPSPGNGMPSPNSGMTSPGNEIASPSSDYPNANGSSPYPRNEGRIDTSQRQYGDYANTLTSPAPYGGLNTGTKNANAKEIANACSDLPNVAKASCAIKDDLCLVGIELKNGRKGNLDSETIAQIEETVKGMSTGINDVFVTNDPDLYRRIKAITSNMRF